MKKIKCSLKSVRMKLFFTLSIMVVIIIVFLILLNNVVLESFYIYSKEKTLIDTYDEINAYYNTSLNNEENMELQLEKVSIKNNFDILIKTDNNISIYSSNRDFISSLKDREQPLENKLGKSTDVIYTSDKMIIKKSSDRKNGLNFILMSAMLDNGYYLYIRTPITSIKESVKISNNFLYLIGGFAILMGAIVVMFISKKFTEPILELNNIAQKMSRLDFSHKYRIKDADDEINNLGKSINIMSDKLERTIRQLKITNIELEKDIEEKSKIDEMRKQFISDVSHELKTPIALIQGYSEGLLENVNNDEESRKFYAEVILDESNKMDKLVKQLLELMKLEYGKREFNNEKFDIVELIKEVVIRSQVMADEKKIKVEIQSKEPIYVYADEFYIEQVVTNYFTNAVKHAEEINGEKSIIIQTKANIEKNKVRISVYNTGNNIDEENLNRIWKRFYKVDASRNREDGGTGIGLSIVKAIMNNYGNDYGVINRENGVEFYFDLDLRL